MSKNKTSGPIMKNCPCCDSDNVQSYDEEYGEIGCGLCNQDGWHHGCCDDLCRGSNEPQDCDFAHNCKHCNPDGDYL